MFFINGILRIIQIIIIGINKTKTGENKRQIIEVELILNNFNKNASKYQ